MNNCSFFFHYQIKTVTSDEIRYLSFFLIVDFFFFLSVSGVSYSWQKFKRLWKKYFFVKGICENLCLVRLPNFNRVCG